MDGFRKSRSYKKAGSRNPISQIMKTKKRRRVEFSTKKRRGVGFSTKKTRRVGFSTKKRRRVGFYTKKRHRVALLRNMNMRGILDIDFLCLKEILKFLIPLDLCSVRQSCKQLKESVDDYCRSRYFVREQWLDLTNQNIRNVNKILRNFGKFVRRLKVGQKDIKSMLLLNVIVTNCGDGLKGLHLYELRLYDNKMERYADLFNNLEILEFIYCSGYKKFFENILLGHQYPYLATLNVKRSNVEPEILEKFFMRLRNIKKLSGNYIKGDLLPLIIQNGSGMEELDIVPEDNINLMLVIQLKKLKRLEIKCGKCDQKSIIALIKELSVYNQLEMLGIFYFEFNDEFCNALSTLTNLRELRLWFGKIVLNDTKSIELLATKLPKLESLILVNCCDFPYRNFLTSACQSPKFRTLTHWPSNIRQINNFIEQMIKDFSYGLGCFVSGNPLFIYLYEGIFTQMEELLTIHNLQSIEKYGNIKIRPAKFDVFELVN